MIAYSIETALRSELFDKVYVCTEDDEIAQVAVSFGATVPQLLPEDLCGDLVASHIPCQYIAARVPGHEKIDSLMCLQPSSPLRSVEDMRNTIDRFSEGRFDFVVSVTSVDPHDFHWAVVPGAVVPEEDNYWRMFFGTQYLKERPLLPPVFRPNGSIKIANLAALEKTGNFFGERLGAVETPVERSVHVALEFDLKLCDTLLNS